MSVARLGRFFLHTAASLAGAALLCLAMLLPGYSLLVWIALVPWAWLYGRPGSRTGMLPGLIGTLVFMEVCSHPLAQYGLFAPVIIGAETAFYYGGGLWLLRATSRRWPSVPIALRFPVIWLAVEWLTVRFEFFRLAIWMTPHPMADWPVFVQASDLFGGMALTLPIAAFNGLIADLLVALGRGEPVPASGPGSPSAARGPSRRAMAGTAAGLAAVLAGILGYGLLRIDRTEPVEGPKVALLQPCLPHVLGRPLGVHIEQVYSTVRDVPPGSADIVMWPENAILDFYDRPHRYMPDLAWLGASRGAHMLVGAIGRSRHDPFRTTNVALLVSPRGEIEGSYEKIDIIPWAEYFPFESLLVRFARPLNTLHLRIVLGTLGYFPTGTPGDRAALFPYEWQGEDLPFAVVLCSEGAIPWRAWAGTRLGARFLVNLISEGDVGGVVQLNMMRLSQLRAVENRRPFVRVGNTGITCLIDESGRVRDVLRGELTGALTDEPGVLLSRVPLPRRQRGSLYVRVREAVPLACIALCAGAALLLLAGRKREGRPSAARAAILLAAPAAGLAGLLVLATAPAGCGGDRVATPADTERALQRGIRAFNEGRDSFALKLLERAAVMDPARKEPYPYIAEILRRNGRTFRGYEYFEKRRDLARTDPTFARYLGYFQMQVHRKTAAVENLERALSGDPGDRAALIWYSALLLDSNRPAELIPRLEAFLGVHPPDGEILRLLAEALLADGRLEQAAATLEQVLADRPGDAAALRMKAIGRLAAEDVDSAERLIGESLASDGTDPETLYEEARIALRKGELERSRRAIDRLQKHQLEEPES